MENIHVKFACTSQTQNLTMKFLANQYDKINEDKLLQSNSLISKLISKLL